MSTVTKATLALVLLASWAPAPADDSDIFLINVVEPNVVILLDSSGSMDDTIGGVRKIVSAKQVINGLINNVQGVRIGVFRFNSSATAGAIVSPIGTDKATMIAQVNSIQATGATPLGRALETVEDYFNGLYGCGATCIGSGGSATCDGDNDEETESDADEILTTGCYPSPIQYECQKNYVILITDGMPNGEPEDLVADVAQRMFNTDYSALTGTQNVIVHTVGFDVPAGATLLQETATNGGGNFYTASNAAQLEQALRDAITTVLEDAYTFAAPVIPSAEVSGGTRAYFASFEPQPVTPFWEGFLRAFNRDADGMVPLDADGRPDASALAWDAGALLAARAANTRTLYTHIGATRHAFSKTNASLTFGMFGVANATQKNQIIDFVYGIDALDGDADGNTAEERSWKLGDIFHSTPVLVFPPPLTTTDASYQAFKSANANRPAVLLVGANDGMLHAFRASDGVELWGFIPNDLLDDLRRLTPRVGSHPYFVDGTPVVADVKTGGTWKTIAIFGQRRGGNRYHALDVTDTTNPLYLWSFTDAELAETWSTPQVGRVRMADGTERWVGIFGGGYNTTSNNATGRGLFVIDLANGTKLWEYKKGLSADKQYMSFSIPSAPTAVDLNRDGFLDRVYIGDVAGQIWKFDLSAPATLSGSLVSNWTGKRLFVASPAAANPPAAGEYFPAQAMFASPTLAYDPYGALWLFVGSGDRFHPRAAASNNFYGIKDDTDMSNGSALTPSSLVDVNSGSSVTQGWYYPMQANEKVLSKADVFNNWVFFTGYLPDNAAICEAGLGTSQLYALSLDDGQPTMTWPDGSSEPSVDGGGGLTSNPEIVIGDATDTVLVGATDGTVTEVEMDSSQTKDVRYWREVY
jgi:type IV pilus assembly protein PilY1